MSAASSGPALSVIDDEGAEVLLDIIEAESLFALTAGLEAATVSACPRCRSRVLACTALVDLLDAAPPHPRGRELVELADGAPTSHVYVEDLATACAHRTWLDPGRTEWNDVLKQFSDGPHLKH